MLNTFPYLLKNSNKRKQLNNQFQPHTQNENDQKNIALATFMHADSHLYSCSRTYMCYRDPPKWHDNYAQTIIRLTASAHAVHGVLYIYV